MREVKDDHLGMNAILLREMMDETIDESGDTTIEIEEEKTVEELSDSTGAFE